MSLEPNLPLPDYSSSHSDMAKRKTKSKTYTDEFIAKALATWDKARAEGKGAAEVAKQLGVHNSMLYYWKARKEGRPWGKGGRAKAAAAKLAAKVPAKLAAKVAAKGRVAPARPLARSRAANAAREEEVMALKREIVSLKEECDVLKKTVMVFARR